MFFSFDGIDGVGKSTQLRLFVEWLQDSYGEDEIVVCRDPGTTKLGETIRELLLDHKSAPISMYAEMLLYMAARAQMVTEVIKPAIESKKIAVCDRYLLANLAYQSYGGKLPFDEVASVGKIATQGVMPDATFLLDIAPDYAATRIKSRSSGENADRMEARGIEFQRQVRAGFLEIAANDPTIYLLDATDSIEAIQEQIRAIATDQMGNQANG